MKSVFPLLLSILLFIAALYWNCVCQASAPLVENFDKYKYLLPDGNPPPLQDEILDRWPFWNQFIFNNYFLGVYVGLTGIRFFFFHPLRWDILRRFLTMCAIWLFLRGTAIIVTAIPPSNPDCVDDPLRMHENGWIAGWKIMFGYQQSCYGQMFSGHTSTYFTTALTWSTYSRGEEWNICCNTEKWAPSFFRRLLRPGLNVLGEPKTWHLTIVITWLYAIAGVIMLLITRGHYTSDCWIAIWMIFFLWNAYHFYIKQLPQDYHTSLSSRFFSWYEGVPTPQDFSKQGKGPAIQSHLHSHRHPGVRSPENQQPPYEGASEGGGGVARDDVEGRVGKSFLPLYANPTAAGTPESSMTQQPSSKTEDVELAQFNSGGITSVTLSVLDPQAVHYSHWYIPAVNVRQTPGVHAPQYVAPPVPAYTLAGYPNPEAQHV